jgi:hypothetical protein
MQSDAGHALPMERDEEIAVFRMTASGSHSDYCASRRHHADVRLPAGTENPAPVQVCSLNHTVDQQSQMRWVMKIFSSPGYGKFCSQAEKAWYLLLLDMVSAAIS